MKAERVKWGNLQRRRAPSYHFRSQMRAEPPFVGRQLFVIYPFGFWELEQKGKRAFTEKLNGNALIFLRKEGLEGSREEEGKRAGEKP